MDRQADKRINGRMNVSRVDGIEADAGCSFCQWNPPFAVDLPPQVTSVTCHVLSHTAAHHQYTISYKVLLLFNYFFFSVHFGVCMCVC